MICDCHLHTAFSGDSNTPARVQIERAVSMRMKEITITDHHDRDSSFCEDNFELDLPSYLSALNTLKEEYRDKIRINIGIELGCSFTSAGTWKNFIRILALNLILSSVPAILSTPMIPFIPPFGKPAVPGRDLRSFSPFPLSAPEPFIHSLTPGAIWTMPHAMLRTVLLSTAILPLKSRLILF